MDSIQLTSITVIDLDSDFNNIKKYIAIVNRYTRFGEDIIDLQMPISNKKAFNNIKNICITVDSLGIKNLVCEVSGSAIMGVPAKAPFYSIYRFDTVLKTEGIIVESPFIHSTLPSKPYIIFVLFIIGLVCMLIF